MPEWETLAVFVAASVALAVVPGPAVVYIVARSIDGGRSAGLVSALGIATGGLVHVAAAVIGLSSLVASSATAFSVAKYAGAAYLVLLGVRRLLARDGRADAPRARHARVLSRVYRDGVVVNILNPKTAVFFLAFLPQFVNPDGGAVAPQLAVLGLIFVAIALVSDSAYGLLAGTASELVRASPTWLRLQRYVSGTIFVGLGVATAIAGSRKNA